ncbi:MAG: flavin reductase family protein [Pseudomonadota bacterium]
MFKQQAIGTDQEVASDFARLVASLDYPLYVVTTTVETESTGCLIGFATQCSIHPPRFLACISKKNHTSLLAVRATVLAVHVVDNENKAIADRFGGETGDEIDKFATVGWRSMAGAPVLTDCDRWFIGSIIERIDLGDHVGYLLEPILVQNGPASEQLTLQQARDIKPGHAP